MADRHLVSTAVTSSAALAARYGLPQCTKGDSDCQRPSSVAAGKALLPAAAAVSSEGADFCRDCCGCAYCPDRHFSSAACGVTCASRHHASSQARTAPQAHALQTVSHVSACCTVHLKTVAGRKPLATFGNEIFATQYRAASMGQVSKPTTLEEARLALAKLALPLDQRRAAELVCSSNSTAAEETVLEETVLASLRQQRSHQQTSGANLFALRRYSPYL